MREDPIEQESERMRTANAMLAYVADVVLSEQYCAFNIMRIKGNHRQCDNYAREEIGGYGFCKQHAKTVHAALAATRES